MTATRPDAAPATPSPARHVLALAVVGAVAATLLFWNLGVRYLWQDEAACAVLAERMMATGKPLSYDGRNLITMDEFREDEAETLPLRTGRAEDAVAYYVSKGDFKDDTTWIGQPWGQFVFAGVPLWLLGHGTLQARLLFALAGVLTALVLYQLVRRRFDDPLMAAIAVALLLGNVFWYLHARQARYYSTATLFLLLALASYLRWQDGRRWGATAFVVSAWCWFQNDFGSLWPVLGLFTVDSLRAAGWRRWKPTLTVMGVLGLTMAPFVLHYELFGRVKETFTPWSDKLWGTLFNVNQYQLPLLALPLVLWLWLRGRVERPGEKRVVGLCVAIVLAQILWMPSVGPMAFYRYVVDCTPLSCLILAFVIVRGAGWMTEGTRAASLRRGLAAGLAVFVAVSPLPSLPTSLLVPERIRITSIAPNALGTRPELRAVVLELAGTAPDPNRAAVEFLRERLRPEDEILVNYEDVPLMFYTSQRIRGGIPAFRVSDPTAPPPRFAVVRRNVDFVHWPVFQAEMTRHDWIIHEVPGPDIPWGNNPDPAGHYSMFWVGVPRLLVFERRADTSS